jgi:hypothetical protein
MKNLVSIWCQKPPIWPFLPTQPTYNPLPVNNLHFHALHGMEEVIGSIPIRSTNYFNNLAEPPPNVWQQIGSKFQTAVQPSHVSRLHLLSEAPRFG